MWPAHALLWNREDTTPYECDGLTAYRERPLVVVLPETYAQVQGVLQACHALKVPVVARGAGTGLSGGAMPHKLGVTLSLAKFNRILKIDAAKKIVESVPPPPVGAVSTIRAVQGVQGIIAPKQLNLEAALLIQLAVLRELL